MSKAKKKATGATRMKQLDYVPVKVWFKREQHNKVVRAARAKGISVAQFIRETVYPEAADIVLAAD